MPSNISITLLGVTENTAAGGTGVHVICPTFVGNATGTSRPPLVISLTGRATGTGSGDSTSKVTIGVSGTAAGTGSGAGKAVITTIALTGSAAGTGISFFATRVAVSVSGTASGASLTPTAVTNVSPTLDGIAKGFAIASTYIPKTDYKGTSGRPIAYLAKQVRNYDAGELLKNV